MVMTNIKLIGKRNAEETLIDVVNIFCENTQFMYQNPIFVLPIPTTDPGVEAVSKLINLRRVTHRVIVRGYIIDTLYSENTGKATELCHDAKKSDGSARAVAFTPADGEIDYDGASCTAMQNVLEKKWVLEQFALAGTQAGGKGLTLQWRDIKNPASGVDYLKQKYNGKVFITDLRITDDARSSEPTRKVAGVQYPAMMRVQMTIIWGDPSE